MSQKKKQLDKVEVIGFEKNGEIYLIAEESEGKFEMYKYDPRLTHMGIERFIENRSMELKIQRLKDFLREDYKHAHTKLAAIVLFGAKIKLKMFCFTLSVSSTEIE